MILRNFDRILSDRLSFFLSNVKQKLQNKPWIAKGILKSIKNKNKQYKKCVALKALPSAKNRTRI